MENNNAGLMNIVNEKDWDKKTKLRYFQERWSAMKSKKSAMTELFAQIDNQVTQQSFYDEFGQLQVIPNLENNLIEIYMGRTNGKVNFEIVPDGQANVDELQPAKYALQFYLDGNDKDNFWKENRKFRYWKSKYGTGVFYTGIRAYKDYRYEVEEDVELESNTDLFKEGNFKKIEHTTWYMFPKAIHPKDFYSDDASYGSSELQDAEDCIYKERISFSEFEMMFWDNKAIDKEEYKKVTSAPEVDAINNDEQSIHQEEINIFYYFNRITKAYYIVANEENLLYSDRYYYDDGKLPFESAQHYPTDGYWGEGVPYRVRYLRVMKGDILQDILQGANMANSVNLLTEGEDELGQDWAVWGGWVNIWRTTGGIDRVQPIQTNINLAYFQNVLQIIDDLVVQDTGDNPRAPIESGEKTLGQTEIKEANKMVRQSAVDEGYNLCLDGALTMTLARIKQFAPSLYMESEDIKWEDGEVLKTKKNFPRIRIDNATVEQTKNAIVIEENLGKYGYFELIPWAVKGIGVKVQTSSSSSVLPILERQRAKEYIDSRLQLLQMAQAMPELAKEIAERTDIQDLMDFMDDSYWRDRKMKAHTKKDKIQKKIEEKQKEILKSILPNPIQNAPQVQGNQEQAQQLPQQIQPTQG